MMTQHTFSSKLSNPRTFFLADTALGDGMDLAGDFLILGDTALFRKLPWILCGDGIPGMCGSGA